MASELEPRAPIESRLPPLLHHIQVDDTGLRLATTEWPVSSGDIVAATCVFIHATGFHSRCWDEVVLSLPKNVHCYAIDVRGHGLSDKPEPVEGVYSWQSMSADISAVLRHFRIKDAIGIGHSMGGYLVLAAALLNQACFRGILLVDPVVLIAEAYYSNADQVSGATGPTTAASSVARRFNSFKSPGDMYTRLRGKDSYRAWQSECLNDYCTYGLLPSYALASRTGWPSSASSDKPDDRMCLACPPHLEAATYAGSRQHSQRARYRELRMPVIILRAEHRAFGGNHRPGGKSGSDWTASPTDPQLWQLFRNAKDIHLLNGTNHFIPMQRPDLIVDHILSLSSEAARAVPERSKL